jgi:hypothetical protein
MAASREHGLSHISWNLQANRMLNNFGATSLNLPNAFNEKGLSHPNLELRFLVINYLVHPDKTSLDLLNTFVYARGHPVLSPRISKALSIPYIHDGTQAIHPRPDGIDGIRQVYLHKRK